MIGFLKFIFSLISSFIKWTIRLFFGDLSSASKVIEIEYSLQKKENKFDYRNYNTNSKDYQTWVDKIYNKLPFHNLINSLLISIGIIMIGFLISLTINFGFEYLNTLAVYLIGIGIFISLTTIRYSSIYIHKSLSDLRPCFMISDDEYHHFLDTWFKRLSNNRILLFLSIIFSIFLLYLLYIKLYQTEYYDQLNLLSLELGSFEINFWYVNPFLWVKFLLISFFVIIVASIIITSIRILIVNIFFLLDLSRLPVIPISNLVRIRLYLLSRLYFYTTLNWFLGVSLFGVMLFTKLDWLSVSVLLLISIVGFITFITPQIIYNRLLSKSQSLATNWIFSSFYKKMNISINEHGLSNIIKSNSASETYKLNSLSDFIGASEPVNRNIYSPIQIISFILGQLIALLSPKFTEIIEMIEKFSG